MDKNISILEQQLFELIDEVKELKSEVKRLNINSGIHYDKIYNLGSETIVVRAALKYLIDSESYKAYGLGYDDIICK